MASSQSQRPVDAEAKPQKAHIMLEPNARILSPGRTIDSGESRAEINDWKQGTSFTDEETERLMEPYSSHERKVSALVWVGQTGWTARAGSRTDIISSPPSTVPSSPGVHPGPSRSGPLHTARANGDERASNQPTSQPASQPASSNLSQERNRSIRRCHWRTCSLVSSFIIIIIIITATEKRRTIRRREKRARHGPRRRTGSADGRRAFQCLVH
ncbi:uncharacterized protein IWZ02DRAFT_5033 [Phyllosticta citriasiana]|uniref:uncharacterized protein n=1 Tax=Phyllosticta citriasiana TaxID=595635 RepID=UPI0030FD4992